ncbi:RTA1 like protein-domain-containing protein [Phaeosphaeriaceae sp. PMI808]|nr:RTA1 like protein-domain-containing protein [Phaeosphaeriaceae sp. PMI808]
MPKLEMYQGEVYLWEYVPSLPAAIIFASLFGLATILHTRKMVRTKMWFCVPFTTGGICEVVGYASRAIGTNNTDSLIPFLLQGIFLLLPPVFFAASLYMVYSRVVRAVQGEHFSLFSPRWSTRIFVVSDLICLNIQSTGGGLLANPENVKIGDAIIVSGLGLQCLIFIGFMYCCIRFHIQFRAHLVSLARPTEITWEPILYMLYSTSILILVRNIYRLVEYVMGKGSYLFMHEWTVYIFDGVLMLIVMLVYLVWYPDRLQERGTNSMMELTGGNDISDDQDDTQKPPSLP